MNQLTGEAPKTPIACTLGSGEVEVQVERWQKLYADAGTERTETDDGLRVRFRRDSAAEHELRGCRRSRDRMLLILEISSSGDGIPVIHSWFLNEEPVPPISC